MSGAKDGPNPFVRGSGMTSDQIRRAPAGALYLWPTRASLSYINALKCHLGRPELEVSTLQILDEGGRRILGRSRSPIAIILDHACEPTVRQNSVLFELRLLIRARAGVRA